MSSMASVCHQDSMDRCVVASVPGSVYLFVVAVGMPLKLPKLGMEPGLGPAAVGGCELEAAKRPPDGAPPGKSGPWLPLEAGGVAAGGHEGKVGCCCPPC